jgi:CRP-like cAMP-binding protein
LRAIAAEALTLRAESGASVALRRFTPPPRRISTDTEQARALQPFRSAMSATAGSVITCSAERALGASRGFARVDGRLLTMLGAQSFRVRALRGSTLFAEGAPADSLLVIASGIVKAVRSTPDLNVNVVGLFGPHDCIGAGAVVFGGVHTVTACAASAVVEVLRIPAAAVRETMAREAEVGSAMMHVLFNYTATLTAKLDLLHAGSVPQRLARLFLMLSDQFGDELEDGSLIIPVFLARSELAAFVGARVESVIRAISAWQKLGWVRTADSGFEILAPHELISIANGQSARCTA